MLIAVPITLDASANAELFGEKLDALTDCSYAFQTLSCETLTASALNDLLYFTDKDSGEALFWVSADSNTQTAVESGIEAEISGTVLAIDTAATFNNGLYTNASVAPSNAVLGEHYIQYVASVLFGHPQAQAPIKNDDTMLSQINASKLGEQFVQALIDDTTTGSVYTDASGSQGVVKAIYEQLLALAHGRFDVSNDATLGDHTDTGSKFRFEAGDVIQFRIEMKGNLNLEGYDHSLATSANAADATAAAVFGSTTGVTYSTGSSATVDARKWRVSLQLK